MWMAPILFLPQVMKFLIYRKYRLYFLLNYISHCQSFIDMLKIFTEKKVRGSFLFSQNYQVVILVL